MVITNGEISSIGDSVEESQQLYVRTPSNTPPEVIERKRKEFNATMERRRKGYGKNRPMRKNVIKQEEVVSALWDFASSIQNRPDEGQVISLLNKDSPHLDCKVSTKHVRAAMERILTAFGYEIVEIV